MWDIILRWFVPFVCGALASIAGTLCIRFRAIKNGLQCLLRAEIIRDYDKYTDRKYAPIYAKQALTNVYNAYHALGGNDVATELYRAVLALPSDPPDKQNKQKEK